MDLTTLVGAAATIASTTSFAPQAWKIIKSRDTVSIPTSMYAVTVTNAICLSLSAFILMMKLLPKREKAGGRGKARSGELVFRLGHASHRGSVLRKCLRHKEH